MTKLPSHSRLFFNKVLQNTQQRNLQEGRALHAQIIQTGSSSCVYIANSLVNFYAKCGHLAEAKLVFEEIVDKDEVSWNCLINGYSQLGGPKGSSSVMDLFQRMLRAENTYPNAHTFAGVFTAMPYLRDPFGGGQQAHSVAIKTGNCSNRLSGEAIGLFKLMMSLVDEGVNEFVLTSVLSAFTFPELVENGKQIHCLALKNGVLSVVSVGNAIVTMYGKCGSLDDAIQAFELLSDKNAILWPAMITCFAPSGVSRKALELFSKMHFSRMMPSEYTLVGVLNACSDIGAAGEGKQYPLYSAAISLFGGSLVPYYLEKMENLGLDIITFGSQLHMLAPKELLIVLYDQVQAMVIINPRNPTGQ
ncbi:hypothetical protein U1Q18_012914 [Sarracenia purpurea var. burkii]